MFCQHQKGSRPMPVVYLRIGLSQLVPVILLIALIIASPSNSSKSLNILHEPHIQGRSILGDQDENNNNYHQSDDFSNTHLKSNANSATEKGHHHHEVDYYDPESTITFPYLNHLNRLPDKEYLSHALAEKACHLDRGCQRKDRLNNTYLSNCSRYKLENLFSNEILMSIMHDSSDGCYNLLDEFIQLDEIINQFDQLFRNLLTRYNCHNGYSVKWSCDDCKVSVYKRQLDESYGPQ